MMYFQTMVCKIQDWLVKVTEGILDISPQKYYLDAPRSLPPRMGHILLFFFFSFFSFFYFLIPWAIHSLTSNLKQVSIGYRDRESLRPVLCEWPLKAMLCSELETGAWGALAAELGASEAASVSVDQGAGSALLGLESEAAWAASLFASRPAAGASVFLASPPSWGARSGARVP